MTRRGNRVVVVEMHGSRRAIAVCFAGHPRWAGHFVAPFASHGERAVVGNRLGVIRGNVGFEACKVAHDFLVSLAVALGQAHVRGAGHVMIGGGVIGDVHDMELSQSARGEFVALHELAVAAGVLRSGEKRVRKMAGEGQLRRAIAGGGGSRSGGGRVTSAGSNR